MPKIISLHDVLEPLKQALLASRDMIISSQSCGSNLQKVFTLGDGGWLPIIVGRTSQLSGIAVDFSGGCDGFCDGFFGPEGRILRRILWRIFWPVFSYGKRRILWRILRPCERGQRRKKGEKHLGVKIHSKIHDQNPRRAPGETCDQIIDHVARSGNCNPRAHSIMTSLDLRFASQAASHRSQMG